MKEIDYIKKDIKALKKHLKDCKTMNTMHLVPVIEEQLSALEAKRFDLEIEQFKEFI